MMCLCRGGGTNLRVTSDLWMETWITLKFLLLKQLICYTYIFLMQ